MLYTGHFIMYYGITKIYYRKTVRHVFTKPVQIEGTAQNIFPSKWFFIVIHISAARRCERISKKMAAAGRSLFVCWNITRVSLWLLRATCIWGYVKKKPGIRHTIATWPRRAKSTDQCSSKEYRCTHVDACVAWVLISYRCVPCHSRCTQKKTF
jgi:hypothetical protein